MQFYMLATQDFRILISAAGDLQLQTMTGSCLQAWLWSSRARANAVIIPEVQVFQVFRASCLPIVTPEHARLKRYTKTQG